MKKKSGNKNRHSNDSRRHKDWLNKAPRVVKPVKLMEVESAGAVKIVAIVMNRRY
jgi:hypothetical protein